MIANINIDSLNFAKAKILVIGDLMLDQYWTGSTDRISPEAPVPIMRIDNVEERLGGAANVAWNLRSLGCQVKVIGVVGNDDAGAKVVELLDLYGIGHDLITSQSFATIRKLRVLSRHQQMLRLDHEAEHPCVTAADLETITKIIKDSIKDYDAVILSDYAKGVLKNPKAIIEIAQQHNVPVYVDPKSNDFSIYKGANVLKPNLKEFEVVVGKCANNQEIEERAHQLLQSCDIQTLVITRGSDGVSIITKDQPAIHLPSFSGEVFDVTGAGDTVMAALVAAESCGLDLKSSVTLSMQAAAVVVAKVGTSTATVAEIKAFMYRKVDLPVGIADERVLKEIIKISQARGEKVVFVNGCYDMLHYGHTRYFNNAKDYGDRLVVGVNSDASVKRLKGTNRPYHNLEQRMEVLANLKAVDWVVSFEEDTPGRLVESLSPDVLVKGGENFKTIDQIPESEGTKHVLNNGGEVHLVARTEDVSSTAMLESL